MLSKRVIAINLTLIAFFSIFPMFSVSGAETFTTDSIETANVSNASSSSQTGDNLIVRSMEYGIKRYAYVAFDLSEFPKDAIPVYSSFKIQCAATSEICYISAFCSSGAEWVGKKVTWETRPDTGDFVSANWIGIMKEWYSYDAESLNNAVDDALAEDGLLTIALKTGIDDVDQYGIIGFYPDASLDISYTFDNSIPDQSQNEETESTPSSGNPIYIGDLILILFLIAVIVVALAFIIKWLRKDPLKIKG